MDKSIQETDHRGIKECNSGRAPACPREREREKKDKRENGTKNQAARMKGRPAELSKRFLGQRTRLSQGFHLLELKVGNLPREGGGSKEAKTSIISTMCTASHITCSFETSLPSMSPSLHNLPNGSNGIWRFPILDTAFWQNSKWQANQVPHCQTTTRWEVG